MSQTIDISEQQRIKRIIDCRQAGEGKASAAEYAYFVRQYSQQVLDFTSHMVTDIADAEEVAQDAFVKAFRSLLLCGPFIVPYVGVSHRLSRIAESPEAQAALLDKYRRVAFVAG